MAVSPSKAPSPIEVTEFGIVIAVRAVSPAKAPPIDVTEYVLTPSVMAEGIVTVVA